MLARPKFRRYISQDASRRFLAGLAQKAEWVDIKEEIRVCRDPKDDKFLDLAINGYATHLVTGDHDLVLLSPFRGIMIIPPDVFLSETE